MALMTALIPVRSPQLPAKLRKKVGASMTTWFEHLGGPARALYRRGLVHFALWLAEAEAIELEEEPEPRTAERDPWEDGACARAGQYLLGFPFHDAIHLVEAYLADCLFTEPRLSRATTGTRLAALRWAVRQARRQNLVQWDLQGAKVPPPRKDRHGKLVERRGRDMRGPEPEEKPKLIAAAAIDHDHRIGIVISMALNEGYREHEIRQIDIADLDLRKKGVWLVRKKRAEPKLYPLCKVTLEAIKRWLAIRGGAEGPLLCGGRHGSVRLDRRVGQKTLFRWVLRCCEAADLRSFSPHRLRHRACTDIVDWGVRMRIPEERLLFLTGHSNRSALQPYYDHVKDLSEIRAVLDASSGYKPKGRRKKR